MLAKIGLMIAVLSLFSSFMPIYAESHVQAVNWQIYLKSDSGKGGYLSARSGGNIIFSDWAEPSEVITLIDINGGDLISRDLVHLKSIHRRFFTADPDTKKVLADQLQARERETFRIIKQNGSGTIRNGDMISLLSNHNEYLGTHPHSTRVVANKPQAGSLETYILYHKGQIPDHFIKLPDVDPQDDGWSCGPNSAARVLKYYNYRVSYPTVRNHTKAKSWLSSIKLALHLIL